MPVQRNILRFTPDRPVVVQLDRGPEGKETQSKFVVEYQYTANRNTVVFWLPPQGRTALVRTGVQQGESVSITKRLKGDAAV